MTKSQHTPGPWTLGDENNYHAEVCIGATDMTAGMCRESRYTGEMVMSRDEMLANAHLIMAAPDLLSEYQTLLDRLKKASDACISGQGQVAEELCHEFAEYASPAIAKAKGEQL